MKNILLPAFTLYFIAAIFTACDSGSSSSSSGDNEITAATFDDLEACTEALEGESAYVKDEKAMYTCEGGKWTECTDCDTACAPSSSCVIPSSSCVIPSSSCVIPSSSCVIPSSSCVIPSEGEGSSASKGKSSSKIASSSSTPRNDKLSSSTSRNDKLSSSTPRNDKLSSSTPRNDKLSSSTPRNDGNRSSSKNVESSSSKEGAKESSSSVVSSSSAKPDSSGDTPSSSSSSSSAMSNTDPSYPFLLEGDEWQPFALSRYEYEEFTDSRNGRTYKYLTYVGKDTSGMYDTISVMSENLNIGEMVPGTGDQSDDSKIERYCYDNDTTICNYMGGLYQWAEMMQLPSECNTKSCADLIQPNHQGICPSGWHLLTYNDFYIVVHSKDNNHGVEGVRSTFGFGGYNNTGYSLVAAGMNWNYEFSHITNTTYWHYPQEYETYEYVCSLSGYQSRYSEYMNVSKVLKTQGLSVRCVMDK